MLKKQLNKTVCFYHLIENKNNINIEGVGDCSICKANGKNKYCKNYIKVNITIINIEKDK